MMNSDSSSCPYYALLYDEKKKENLVYCANPSKHMRNWIPRDRKIPLSACQKCYERRQYIQAKKIADIKKMTAEVEEEEIEEDVEEVEEDQEALQRARLGIQDYDKGICTDFLGVAREKPITCHVCKIKNSVKFDVCQSMQKEVKSSAVQEGHYINSLLGIIKEGTKRQIFKELFSVNVQLQEQNDVHKVRYETYLELCKQCEAFYNCNQDYCTSFYEKFRAKLSADQLAELKELIGDPYVYYADGRQCTTCKKKVSYLYIDASGQICGKCKYPQPE